MIDFFKNWCEGIIVAVVISIIVETILPENNNKKYVKVIVGIYIIFTILNPVLGKLNADIDFSENFKLATVETSTTNTDNIKEMYLEGINQTLKSELKEKFGYNIENLEVSYDENYENIEYIKFEISEDYIESIAEVNIGNEIKNDNTNNNYSEVKKYISDSYGISTDKIFIN